jgi:uncharacterized protein YjbJ (UPF0337 family)
MGMGVDRNRSSMGRQPMTNTQEAKGRLKEAAGDLSDDKDLKREGKIDRATAAAKEKVDAAADKLKDTVRSDD